MRWGGSRVPESNGSMGSLCWPSRQRRGAASGASEGSDDRAGFIATGKYDALTKIIKGGDVYAMVCVF